MILIPGTLKPSNSSLNGYALTDARYVGGHRSVATLDDLYALSKWQLVNAEDLDTGNTANAVGLKWYVKGDGTYMLKDYSKHDTAAGWVKVEDVNGNVLDPSDNKTIISKIQSAGGDITGIVSRVNSVENKLNYNVDANKPGNPLVLDTNGYLKAFVGDVAFKKINGVSILKSNSDKNDITIDLSLFIVPSDNKLPTANINSNKIYLIKKDGTPTGNIYIEYMYVNGAWEQLGEYKSEVDLTPYLKKLDAESTYLKISSWDVERERFVQVGSNTPVLYVLESKLSTSQNDATVITKAASVAYAFSVGKSVVDYVDTTLANFSKIEHTHTVRINGNTKTISNNVVDLGTYVTASTNIAIEDYTYNKAFIDGKISESINKIQTIGNEDVDSMWDEIFTK